ncbi:uncharacterized protein LOC134944244 [Pseudophryne corroboree]|uniref:uncharacterized protein LOC134944244 n=1 Tax=Pseudophryne corroboree TaxID=495146 RepID=UPI00308163B7
MQASRHSSYKEARKSPSDDRDFGLDAPIKPRCKVFREHAQYTRYLSVHGKTEISNLLTGSQLASASTSSNIVSNATAVTTLVFSYSGDINGFSSYVSTLRLSVLQNPSLLSPKVKESLLLSIAQIVFQQFTALSDTQFQSWITGIDFLLPSINSTILDYIPKDISCSRYQIIVLALNNIFQSLSVQKQTAVAAFENAFLTYQYNSDGDACTAGISNTPQYAQKNFGEFCYNVSADAVAMYYPSLNKVSFTAFCKLQ